MRTVGFLPYPLRADEGNRGAHTARNLSVGSETNDSNSTQSNGTNTTNSTGEPVAAVRTRNPNIPEALDHLYMQQLEQTAWVGETFRANLEMFADLGWGDLAHQTVRVVSCRVVSCRVVSCMSCRVVSCRVDIIGLF